MNFAPQDLQTDNFRNTNYKASIKFLNDENDISDLLNKGYNKVINDINNCDKINIGELREFCENLLIQSELFNKNLEDWYDDKFYCDLEQFKKKLFEEENKTSLFEESNSIIIR
jgi:hypothetical protein